MIFNSSPLIILSKLNKVSLLKEIYPKVEISEGVYEEVVVKGLEKNLSDALIIKDYIDKVYIKVCKLNPLYAETSQKISKIYGIASAEAETIALALQYSSKEVVIDERSAREAAIAFNIKPLGSLRILLLAYEKNLFNENMLKEVVHNMMSTNYRFSPSVLIEFWKLFEKLKKKKYK